MDLYQILYTIPEDGTKSHRKAADIVKQWTLEGRKLWSVDLSNATDRFPMDLQVNVVAGIRGKEYREVWRHIMLIP